VTESSVLDFEAFAEHVSDGLRLEPDTVVPEARLVEDLGLDSFDLVELLTLVEELGVHFPDDVAVGVETVGDLYREYAERAGRGRSRR
jgi:acyl carrier protein